MAVALKPRDLTNQENHLFLPHINTDDTLHPDLSSPSECPSLGESFTSRYPTLMERELSQRASFNSPPTSPGWCSMKTPSPIPTAAQTHKVPFVEGYRPGTELDFDDATLLSMMHFGLVESEMWSHRASQRIEPPLMNSSAAISTADLSIQDEGHLSQVYPSFSSSFGVNPPLSRPIFGLDQAMHNPASTEEGLITCPGHATEPQQTIEPSAAFESALTSPQVRREEPSTPCRTNALSMGILITSPMTWVSPPMVPSQHDMDDDMQYETADHAVMSSDSASNSSPPMNRRWSAATAHDTGKTSLSLHRRGHERRRKVGPSRKPRPESGKSGIHCDAVIAHNEFACSWPNCIDKATGKQKRFKRQEHKKRHEKTVHEKEGSYRCWVPGCTTTAFTRTDNLKSHLRNTHGKKSPNQRNRYVATQDKNSEYYDPDWQGELTEDGYPMFHRKR